MRKLAIIMIFWFIAVILSAQEYKYSNQRTIENKYGGNEAVDVEMSFTHSGKNYLIPLGSVNVKYINNVLITNKWTPKLLNFGDYNNDGIEDLMISQHIGNLGEEECIKIFSFFHESFICIGKFPLLTDSWGGGDVFFLKDFVFSKDENGIMNVKRYTTWSIEVKLSEIVPSIYLFNKDYFYYTPENFRIGIVNDNDVRFRTKPSLESQVIRKFEKNEQVLILDFYDKGILIDGIEYSWAYIKDKNGYDGWVCYKYIDKK